MQRNVEVNSPLLSLGGTLFWGRCQCLWQVSITVQAPSLLAFNDLMEIDCIVECLERLPDFMGRADFQG